jgi:hypothetical protein
MNATDFSERELCSRITLMHAATAYWGYERLIALGENDHEREQAARRAQTETIHGERKFRDMLAEARGVAA